jgi:hypothetical protein
LTRSKDDPTVTRSFRISARALKAIEEEAYSHNISVNTILNQQLLAFADFERFFRRLGLIKISSATFQRLLEAAPDKEIAQAARDAGGDTPKSIILAEEGSFNLQTAISFLQSLSEYASQFEYGEVNSGGKRIITLLHRLGPKGTVFFSNYTKALFEQLGLFPKISTSDHSVTIELVPERETAKNESF